VEVFIPITLFFCVAAVMILRPITKKLGGLLEVMTVQRTQVRQEDQTSLRVAMMLEQVGKRLDSIEERLDFTERLVATPRQPPKRQFQRRPVEELEEYLIP
jgi:hypothetical protein